MTPGDARRRLAWGVVVALAVAIAAVVVWQVAPRGQDLPILQVQGSSSSRFLEVGVGACFLDTRVSVDESASDVTVRVSVSEPMPDICPAVLEIIRVQLDSPLRERTVIDGSTGQTVPVEPHVYLESEDG